MPGGPSATNAPRPVEKPALLLGEGRDEVAFFRAMLKHLDIQGVQIEDYGGKSKLRPALKGLSMRSEFGSLRTLAVTRDADDNPAGVRQSVEDALRNAGLYVPTTLETIEARLGSGPHVGIFLLPGGGRPGMLESLCVEAIQSDPLLSCVNDFVDCLSQHQAPVVGTNREPKAWAYAWLASRSNPDLRVGEAAEKGEWPLDHAAFDGLKAFLRQLGAGAP